MTWIKICGITNLEDARTAVEAGANALGFVFYDKSPRNIDAETVGKIVAKLPAQVEKVGVFVNDAAERIDESVRHTGLTAVQLCGKEAAARFIQYSRLQQDINHRPKVIFVIAGEALSEGVFFIGDELKNALHALLIDSVSAGQPGGTGERFDWEKARKIVEILGATVPTIVAGGLTPKNVGEAMNLLRPWGVDVCSGVESRPGKKDAEKVRAFVAAVRQAEKLT